MQVRRARPGPRPQARAKTEIRIALDSQSAITALAKGPASQTGALEMRVWERLTRVSRLRRAHVVVVYVPGHVELDEQELADDEAKEAARHCPQGAAPVPLSLVKAVLRGHQRRELRDAIADADADHLFLRATDGRAPRHAGLSRSGQCTLSQLRAGRCAAATVP